MLDVLERVLVGIVVFVVCRRNSIPKPPFDEGRTLLVCENLGHQFSIVYCGIIVHVNEYKQDIFTFVVMHPKQFLYHIVESACCALDQPLLG